MIEISHISKAYADINGYDQKIFTDFNLKIPDSELLVIFGPSGCGKSTLINILAGVEACDSGSVKNDHGMVRVGFVSQYDSLLPWLNVIDNVAFGLKLQGIDRSSRLKIAEGILEEMGMEKYAFSHPYQLSGGQSQLVSFARAIAYDAKFMLMDEPFSSLDFLVRNRLQNIILRLHRARALTTVFVTHQIDEALFLGDRIIALSAGKPTEVLIDLDVRSIKSKDSKEFYELQEKLLNCYR